MYKSNPWYSSLDTFLQVVDSGTFLLACNHLYTSELGLIQFFWCSLNVAEPGNIACMDNHESVSSLWCNWLPYTQEAELAQQKEAPPSNTPLGAEEGAEPHDRPQQKTFGGYNCEFVEPPPSVFQTECPICSLILRDPYHSKCCGTNFCHTCSERIQDEHKPCPTCRDDNFELFANTSLKRSITQLYVLCTHSKLGCMWKGELGELENHLSEVVHSGELVVWLKAFCYMLGVHVLWNFAIS